MQLQQSLIGKVLQHPPGTKTELSPIAAIVTNGSDPGLEALCVCVWMVCMRPVMD